MTQKDGESDWQGSQVLRNDMVVSFLSFLFALHIPELELKKWQPRSASGHKQTNKQTKHQQKLVLSSQRMSKGVAY